MYHTLHKDRSCERSYTARTAGTIILTFLTGLLPRLKGEDGYRGY